MLDIEYITALRTSGLLQETAIQTKMSALSGIAGPSPYNYTSNVALPLASSNEVAGLRSILIGKLNLRAFVHGMLVFDMVTAPPNLFIAISRLLMNCRDPPSMGWACL